MVIQNYESMIFFSSTHTNTHKQHFGASEMGIKVGRVPSVILGFPYVEVPYFLVPL